MRSRGRILTEKEIRYAMEITNSVAQASAFLRINMATFKKYASMFIDADTGKTLYELHCNQRGNGIAKRIGLATPAYLYKSNLKFLIELLQGKHPKYFKRAGLKEKLFAAGFKAEKCDCCGFSERREIDGQAPLTLIYKDGDKTNHLIENLLILCHNCAYIQYGYYKHIPASYNEKAFEYLDEPTVDPEYLVPNADGSIDTDIDADIEGEDDTISNDANEILDDIQFTQDDIDAIKRDI